MVRALDDLLTASGDEPPAGHVVWLSPDQAAGVHLTRGDV
jgi:hypothetical protein